MNGLVALTGSVLAASLIGSPHCAGMCGGFVCFYSGQEGRGRVWPHVAYSAGRLISYATLGAIAGLLGAGVERMGAAAGFGRAAAILAGALMIVWGGATLLAAFGVRVPGASGPATTGGGFARILRAVRALPATPRALVVGLVTTLLPCGWLYAFVATAGGTGSPLAGAAVMAAFWVGTVPVMAAMGLAAQGLFGPLRRRLPAITASALVVLGLLTVAGKFQLGRAQAPCPRCAPTEAHGAR